MTKFRSTNYSFEIELFSSLRDNYTMVTEQNFIKWTVESGRFRVWCVVALRPGGSPIHFDKI